MSIQVMTEIGDRSGLAMEGTGTRTGIGIVMDLPEIVMTAMDHHETVMTDMDHHEIVMIDTDHRETVMIVMVPLVIVMTGMGHPEIVKTGVHGIGILIGIMFH